MIPAHKDMRVPVICRTGRSLEHTHSSLPHYTSCIENQSHLWYRIASPSSQTSLQTLNISRTRPKSGSISSSIEDRWREKVLLGLVQHRVVPINTSKIKHCETSFWSASCGGVQQNFFLDLKPMQAQIHVQMLSFHQKVLIQGHRGAFLILNK